MTWFSSDKVRVNSFNKRGSFLYLSIVVLQNFSFLMFICKYFFCKTKSNQTDLAENCSTHFSDQLGQPKEFHLAKDEELESAGVGDCQKRQEDCWPLDS